VGISSCLLGEEVRYNGGHKKDNYITGTLSQYFELRPMCPEVGIGMGVPRPPIRLIATDSGPRAVGVKDAAIDVTDELVSFATDQQHFLAELDGYILKRGSPSCGMERVKLFNAKGIPENRGVGLFAASLIRLLPNLPLEEEGRLGDARLRENFVQRVFVYHRWRKLVQQGLNVASLTTFHAQLKLILMSHDQNQCRSLGKLVAGASKAEVNETGYRYISGAMQTLKKIATRKNHVNVMQHIQGYLKQNLDPDDKQELLETIQAYHRDEIPLVVPLTLLKHFFRKSPDAYIERSWYMNPYPAELKLRNLL
jgi:uncharacterized protein YbgA (DUF1722 family)/uncharacterized protein YbbK (DUF523 family)